MSSTKAALRLAEAIDEVTPYVLAASSAQPIVVEWGRDTARSTSPPMIGAAEFTLANYGREFSPENPATARYQFIKTGRPVRIASIHGDRRLYRSQRLYRSHTPYRGAGRFPLFTGRISAIAQDLAELGSERTVVSALDLLAGLRRKTVSVALEWGGLRTDEIVQRILDAAGWPAADRVLRIGDSIVNGYWVDERSAWDCLVEMLATEGAGAAFFVDALGVFYWFNRNHRAIWPRSTVTQATLHDGTSATGLLYTRLSYDPRWEDVVDRVTVTTRQRQLAGSESVIWKLGTSLSVAAGETRVIWARPSEPFQGAVSPVLTTDYTVSGGTVSIALEWSNGAVAKLNIVGLSGTSTISDLQLRGKSFPVVGETIIESEATVTSDVEAKTLAIGAWPELDMNQAQAIADSYLARYGDSHPILEVTLQNLDGEAQEAILRFQISDRIKIGRASCRERVSSPV